MLADSSYSACTELAYCIGIINMQALINLRLIGSIRNLFAHSFATIDFDTQEVHEKCHALIAPVGRPWKPGQSSARDRFWKTTLYLFCGFADELPKQLKSPEERAEFGDYLKED